VHLVGFYYKNKNIRIGSPTSYVRFYKNCNKALTLNFFTVMDFVIQNVNT